MLPKGAAFALALLRTCVEAQTCADGRSYGTIAESANVTLTTVQVNKDHEQVVQVRLPDGPEGTYIKFLLAGDACCTGAAASNAGGRLQDEAEYRVTNDTRVTRVRLEEGVYKACVSLNNDAPVMDTAYALLTTAVLSVVKGNPSPPPSPPMPSQPPTPWSPPPVVPPPSPPDMPPPSPPIAPPPFFDQSLTGINGCLGGQPAPGESCFKVGTLVGICLGGTALLLCYCFCLRPLQIAFRKEGFTPGKLKLGLRVIQTVPQNQATTWKSGEADIRGLQFLRRHTVKIAATLIVVAAIGAFMAIVLLAA